MKEFLNLLRIVFSSTLCSVSVLSALKIPQALFLGLAGKSRNFLPFLRFLWTLQGLKPFGMGLDIIEYELFFLVNLSIFQQHVSQQIFHCSSLSSASRTRKPAFTTKVTRNSISFHGSSYLHSESELALVRNFLEPHQKIILLLFYVLYSFSSFSH